MENFGDLCDDCGGCIGSSCECRARLVAKKRLDALLRLLEGCKWTDIAALGAYKPEEEKYITRDSLLAALDAAIADKSAN